MLSYRFALIKNVSFHEMIIDYQCSDGVCHHNFVRETNRSIKFLNFPIKNEQGRIHGQYQLRTGGQGRICAFSHFSTRVHGPTNRPTDGRTDGRTKPLIELRVRN